MARSSSGGELYRMDAVWGPLKDRFWNSSDIDRSDWFFGTS